MIKRIYSVYDVQTSAYSNPMFLTSDGEAIRVAMDAVAKPGSTLSDHPQDFSLRYLGDMNMVTGEIVSVTPVPLVELAQLVKK